MIVRGGNNLERHLAYIRIYGNDLALETPARKGVLPQTIPKQSSL